MASTRGERSAEQFTVEMMRLAGVFKTKRHPCAAESPVGRSADVMLSPIQRLEEKLDRWFFPRSEMPTESLSFRGGSIRRLRCPSTGETSNRIEIDGRISQFSVGIGEHGLFGSATHIPSERGKPMAGTKSIAAIEMDLREAHERTLETLGFIRS